MKKRKLDDREQIESILEKALVCRLGMADENRPYVVPMNFGYRDGVIYCHTGPGGKKMDILRRNPLVCFEVDTDHAFIRGEQACQWSMKFRSVVGYGRAELAETDAEKRAGLDVLMAHYSDRSYDYPDEKLAITAVIRIVIDRMHGMSCGYE